MRKSILIIASIILSISYIVGQNSTPTSTKKEIFKPAQQTLRTSPSGVMHSMESDMDISWSRFGAGFAKAASMEYAPNGTTLYGAKGSAIYISEDNGETWSEIFKMPNHSYLSAHIYNLFIHDSDTNSLYFTVDFTYTEEDKGLFKLDLINNTHQSVYYGQEVLDFSILGTTNTDTMAVLIENFQVGHEVWITVDGGVWWKNIHSGTYKEQVEYFYNDNGNIELVIGGTDGLLHLDFTEAWATQTFDWINDIKTIERGDSVDFTRTCGEMAVIPGTRDMLLSHRWFNTDRYEDGDAKRAKFWKVSFEDKFAAEYTNITWNDDTTRISDLTHKGYGVTDLIFSYAFDKNNPNTWWAGEGNEVLRTDDAGATWTTDTFTYRELWIVYDLVLDVNNSGHIILVGESNNIETFDYFESFEETGIQGLVLQDMDFHKDAEGNLTFYYADWSQYMYSEDESGNLLGTVRLDYDIPIIGRVEADPYTEGRFFVTTGHDPGSFIHRSSDFGQTEEISYNSIYMGTPRTIEANPAKANEIWFIGDPNTLNPFPTVMKSKYGGDIGSWNKIIISESGEEEYSYHDFIAFNPLNKDVVYSNGLYGVGTEGVIDFLRSEDGGKTWKKFTADNGLPRYGDGLNELDVNPFDTAFLFASSYTWPYISTDGGQSWEEQVMTIAEIDTLSSYSFRDLRYTAFENVIVGRGFDNNILISNNNGKHWISLRDGVTLPDYLFLSDVEVDVNADSTQLFIYCASDGASMLKLAMNVADLDWENPSDGNTAINKVVWNNEAFVYPNPTRGIFSIKNAEGAQVSIYNQSGSLIYNGISENEEYVSDVLVYHPDGLYIITVRKGNSIKSDKILLTK